jgi:hypothetical protein
MQFSERALEVSKQRQPTSLFLSYAHEDELLLKKLATHLSVLEQQGGSVS